MFHQTIGSMLLLTLSKIWNPQAKAMNTQGITPMVGYSLSLTQPIPPIK